jgi:hypothetical protein
MSKPVILITGALTGIDRGTSRCVEARGRRRTRNERA